MFRLNGLLFRKIFLIAILFSVAVIWWNLIEIQDSDPIIKAPIVLYNVKDIAHQMDQEDSEVEDTGQQLDQQDSEAEESLREPYQIMESYRKDSYPVSEDRPAKRLLFWNEAYGTKNFDIGLGKDVFRKAGCPVWQCESSDNRSNPDSYDAIVFHQRSWVISDLPKKRLPSQRYIYWMRESPSWRFVKTDPMAGFFNWTLTYRWDSESVFPYGWFSPVNKSHLPMKPEPELLRRLLDEPPPVNYAGNKTKMAAWFVSNCKSHSNRNQFVKLLQEFVPVDIYGRCGSLDCPRSKEGDCRQLVERDYKFYLSLENSLCLDYVTEKFFSIMNYNIIPIVFDLHGHHKRLAPPHSYINAADFPSVRALADYLKLLDEDNQLYNQYFWWKGHYSIHGTGVEQTLSMCHLCALLHMQDDPSSPLPAKVYEDVVRQNLKSSLHSVLV